MLPSRRQVWAERLNRFRDSSQSVKAFCQAENVSVPSFYQWKKRLTDAEAATEPAFVPVNLAGLPSLAGQPSENLDLVLPGGATLKLSMQFDDAAMRKVISAVVAATTEADAS